MSEAIHLEAMQDAATPSDAWSAKLFDNRIVLITVEELADSFGVSPKTIRNYVAKRIIPFVRVGRRTMFRVGSIETWLERKERKPWQ